MSKSLDDLFYEVDDVVFIELITKRLPVGTKFEIINKKLCENPKNAFIDVAFAFEDVPFPREAFYTHIYYGELDKYLNNKNINNIKLIGE